MIPDPTLRQIVPVLALHKIEAVRTRPALSGLVLDPVIQANLVPVLVLSRRPVLNGPDPAHPDLDRDLEVQPDHSTPEDLVHDLRHRWLGVQNHVPAVELRPIGRKAEVPQDPEVDRAQGQVLR